MSHHSSTPSAPVSRWRFLPHAALTSLVAVSALGFLWYRRNSRRRRRSSAKGTTAFYEINGVVQMIRIDPASLPIAYSYLLSHSRILLFSDAQALQAALEEKFLALKQKGKPIVCGLDCEWYSPNGSSSRLAVLQLAVPGCVFLIQLQRLSNVPAALKEILSDPEILKMGVAIAEDARKLTRDLGFFIEGCVDLGPLSRRDFGISSVAQQNASLATLCETLMEFPLPKDKTIVRSNWERELSDSQILYAAADGFYGMEIFWKLWEKAGNSSDWQALRLWVKDFTHTDGQKKKTPKQKKKREGEEAESSPMPPQPVDIPVEEEKKADPPALSVNPPEFLSPAKAKTPSPAGFSTPAATPSGGVEPSPRSTRLVCRTTQLYDNCRLLSNTGVFMAFVNKKKVQWYFSRGLADLLDDEGAVIQFDDSKPFADYLQKKDGSEIACRLRFPPAGLGNAKAESSTPVPPSPSSMNYYLEFNENRCVCCGSTEQFRKHYIVPAAYRKFFPRCYKSHSSHDILLLCNSCHREAEALAVRLMKQIASETKFPLHANQTTKEKAKAKKKNTPRKGEVPAAVEDPAVQRLEALKVSISSALLVLLDSAAPSDWTFFPSEFDTEDFTSFTHTALSEVYYSACMIAVHGNSLEPQRKKFFEAALKEKFPQFTIDAETCELIMEAFEEKRNSSSQTTVETGVSESLNNSVTSDSPSSIASLTRLSHFELVGRELLHLLAKSGSHNSVYSFFDPDPLLSGFDPIALFCVRWRKAFIEALNPQFLNKGWSVHFNQMATVKLRNSQNTPRK